MKSFLTGSHAYGTPNKNSDIDLVICMSKKEGLKLGELTQPDKGEQMRYGSSDLLTMRFGDLNLIVCLSDEVYAAWKVGTHEAKRKKPLDKTKSKNLFAQLFTSWGFK